jgi:hypothetical protein
MTTPSPDDPHLDPDYQPDNIALEDPTPEELERLRSISVHPTDEPSDSPTSDPDRPSNPA